MKKEKKERKPMKEWAKITLIVTTSVLGFFVFTFIVTFLGGELPWTAQRSSAIYVEEEALYGDYGVYGQKCYFDENDQVRKEQYKEIFHELEALGDRFGLKIWCDGIADKQWLRVCYDDNDKGKIFFARGLLNLYAKWNDIPIFWRLDDVESYQAH